MTRRLEQGNVVGFVLVGILLTAVLVGGIWFVRHPAGDSSSQTTSDTIASKDTDSVDTDTAQSTTDKELQETLKQQATKSTDKEQSPVSTPTSDKTDSIELPTTGPADTAFEMVGAMLLVGTSVAYLRSRVSA